MKTKRILNRTTLLMIAIAIVMFAAVSSQALADCNGKSEKYLTFIVTYYEVVLPYDPSAPSNSLCTRFQSGGRTFCQIRLRGTLYYPKPEPGEPIPPVAPQFPAIIVNHGSGPPFEAYNKHCEIANYFVPEGYMVFVPFRRGQGDHDLRDRSTGIYIEDMLDDFSSANPTYNHPTNCTTRGCYKAEILEQQADLEITYAAIYLKNRSDIKRDKDGYYALAIMGNSYGGAVTAFANENFLGQRAAVVFSPGAQQWEGATCLPGDQTCGGEVQKALLSAARNAKYPVFYLQAKWDYDTRATIDLAYAHAYGSTDPKHGNRFMASIFPYPKPGIDPDTRELDYQSVHAGFFKEPNRWGAAVLEFLRQYGVE